MIKNRKRTAFIIATSILGGGIILASTVLITKAVVESQYNKNIFKINFNGYKCHLNGNTTVKKGEKYSAIITSDDENYDPNVYSVKMGDKDIDYTFNNGHLIIDIPTTGDISINAIATDKKKVYATGIFHKNGNEYEVIGVDTNDLSCVTDLYIPATITDSVTNSEIPVTSIANGALYGLSNLKNLTIPFIGGSKTLDSQSQEKNLFGYIFGSKLFEGVRTLTWQYYGDTTGVYFGAAIPSSLKSVTILNIPQTNQKAAFNNCANIENIDIIDCPSETSFSVSMFEGCSSLKKISYPTNVKTLCNNCFKNCSSLTEADFTKNGVTSIGDYVFNSCTSLERVKLPSRITTIGANAFANLSTAVIFCEPKVEDKPAGWSSTMLGNNSFTPVIYGDLYPESIQSGDYQYLKVKTGNDTYDAYVVAYNGSNLGTIDIPQALDGNPVVYIGPRCFMELDKITQVNINANNLKTIGSYAFEGCTSLETINLKDCSNLKSLGAACFYECNQLKVDDSDVGTNYFLPSSLINIGNYCFYNCHHILNINLEGVRNLGDYSFAYCCYNYIDPITGELVFSNKDYKGNDACLTKVTVNTDLDKIGVGTFMNARELKAIAVKKGSREDPSIFNNIPDFCFYHTKIGGNSGFQVTSSLETIGAYAFGYCTSLCKLDFSLANSVKSIGEGAFINCSNISGDVALPESLENIGAYCFEECVKLESLNIKSNTITSVPFDFCFDCESLKSVSFAKDLTEIEDFAFGGCKSLTTFNNSTDLILNNSLQSLGNYCFSNCSSLKSIKLSANASLENGLNIGSNVFAGWTKDQTIKLNKDLFDYYKKAKTVKTKFGWEMKNRTKIFGILSDNYSCEASGSSNVIISVE